MHSIGALVKAIGASQNTHFHNNTEKFARLLILSSLKTELIKIINGYTANVMISWDLRFEIQEDAELCH